MVKKHPVPIENDVPSRTFKCNNCGQIISGRSMSTLPRCPKCHETSWRVLKGREVTKKNSRLKKETKNKQTKSERDSKLRVCASYLCQERNRKVLRQSRLIILEHILPTTEALVYNLANAGVDIHAIIAKPYSIDLKVLERLKKKNYNIHQYTYEKMETTNVLNIILRDALKKSEKDEKRILIIDVGGYFAKVLITLPVRRRTYVAGVVEDTTFGHNRYLSTISKINVPVISVALSKLKEVEAHFVSRDAVQAVDLVMREVGESITGRNALVIGYGMIGKNVARALRAADLNVGVYDIRDHRNLKAFMKGFRIHKKVELLRKADIIFAATGWSSNPDPKERKPALTWDEIVDVLKDDAVLVSVGSKDNEFDIKTIKEQATSERKLSKYVIEYELRNDNRVFVVKDGTATNFILPSIPTEILDLVFGEIVLASILLLKNPYDFSVNQVNQIDEKYWSYVAKDWLRFANHQP